MANSGNPKSSFIDYKTEFFFDLSFDLLCIAGYDGYFKKINPAVVKILGYTEEELFSKPINEFVYKDDRDITQQNRENLRNSIPLLNFENRYLTKSGEIVWLFWTSVPIDSEQLVYAIAKDITYKKKLEEERNLLLANLTKVNNDLKLVSYTASHNLRSPVNNLISVFELLAESKIENEEVLELIAALKATTYSLKESLNNYVEVLNKHDRLSVETEEVNLKETLTHVKQAINSLIYDSKTIFRIDFSAFETISFNAGYLESIFLNLITNAIKYAVPNQQSVITIFTREFEGVKQLVFADNGLGFDMDKVGDKVFGLNQKFNQHKDSMGIGLYLVHNHITSMGGNIVLESKKNEGAKFILSFH
ncbi:MAG: PAS domain-containing sensor histidine kinase [Bacteroidota bacterium]